MSLYSVTGFDSSQLSHSTVVRAPNRCEAALMARDQLQQRYPGFRCVRMFVNWMRALSSEEYSGLGINYYGEGA